jgi:hypothetical protein
MMIPYSDIFVIKNNFFVHNSTSCQKIGRQVPRKPNLLVEIDVRTNPKILYWALRKKQAN